MKDQNKLAGRGVTDMEYIDLLGLDPALEGKPEINDAIYKSVRQKNVDTFIGLGKTEEEANREADRLMRVSSLDHKYNK